MTSNSGTHRVLAAVIAVVVATTINVGWLKGMDRDAAAAIQLASA